MPAPAIPVVNLNALWNNAIIYTTFDEGFFGVNAATNSFRVFYMWDLDWQTSGYSYEQMKGIVDKSDRLYVRSSNYLDVVYNFFGRMPNGVVTNFDIKDLVNDN